MKERQKREGKWTRLDMPWIEEAKKSMTAVMSWSLEYFQLADNNLGLLDKPLNSFAAQFLYS